MIVLILLAASLLATSTAMAEPPANCSPARLSRLEFSSKSLRIAAAADTPLDPTASGLQLVLAQEPETAADATLMDVTLPAAGFATAPGGFRYEVDADQGPGGIV